MLLPPGSPLSFESIQKRWSDAGIPLYPVRIKSGQFPAPDAETLSFLEQVGFPDAAEPELDFTDLGEQLYTHTRLYAREDFPRLDQYLVIGATGKGNPVCLDVTDQHIVYIDHDHGFEIVFINSSLIQFSYCLACYQSLKSRNDVLTLATVKELEAELTGADPDCRSLGSFWDLELSQLEREADL